MPLDIEIRQAVPEDGAALAAAMAAIDAETEFLGRPDEYGDWPETASERLREFTLGVVLVLAFSIGLAVTLVVAGAAAALSLRHATQRWSWFGAVAGRAPYVSGLLIVGVGLYVGHHGWAALHA